MKIGFLACPETMPASGTERRGDAFEHDLQLAALRPAFKACGLELAEINWHAPMDEFSDFALILLGTAWDYQDYPEEFLARLIAIEGAGITVCNSPALVRWNIDKTYLKDIAQRGVATVPTIWADNPGRLDVQAAFEHFDCENVVVKRQVGAGGLGQYLFGKADLPAHDWRMGHKAMIQPYLPAIKQEGELSFVFIDGEFSHGVRKIAAADEYRIQSLYGGREEIFEPAGSDIAAAGSVIDAMNDAISGEKPLYARIDMLRGDGGALVVMEAEAIEPYLYPQQGPNLGERLAKAIIKRL